MTPRNDDLDHETYKHCLAPPFSEGYKNAGDGARRPFVSCDTETYADDAHRQRPMLFGFSTGAKITGRDIFTADMLALCVHTAKSVPGAIFVGFFFDYDVNFIIKNLPDKAIYALVKGDRKACYWKDYRLQYLRGKFFRVSHGRLTERRGGSRWETSITIYSTEGWFGRESLVKAAKEHLPGDPRIALVEKGKGERNRFTFDDLESVEKYWTVEQTVLVSLMDKIREQITAAHLPLPLHWWGSSALSQIVMQQKGVRKHQNKSVPPRVLDAAQFGYFGGRFEQFKAGHHNAPVYQYDIISAYPEAMTKLWSWDGAEIEHISNPDRTGKFPPEYGHSIWRVKYQDTEEGYLWRPMPLPMRTRQGLVYYPMETTGWYWSPEVALVWRDPRATITEGYVIHESGGRPFSFLSEMYQQRAALKRAGDPAQYALKIAMNAMYGKVAQRAGARQTRDGRWRIPPFHQLDWAGWITSYTRAKLHTAVMSDGARGGNTIFVETDALFTTQPIASLSRGKGDLGDWEVTEHSGVITVQSGIYWTRKQSGEWSPGKIRGLARGSGGIKAEQCLVYLENFKYDHDSPSVLRSVVPYFHGYSNAFGTSKLFHFDHLPREIKFAGGDSGKRFYNPGTEWRGDHDLVPLMNGGVGLAIQGIPFISHPHPLPWRPMGVTKDSHARAKAEEFEDLLYVEWE